MDSQLYRDFARLEDHHWWFVGRRAVVEAVLARHLSSVEGRRVLDVGCGTGGMLPMLRRFGAVEGLESSEEGLALCRARMGPEVEVHGGGLPDGLPAGRRYGLVTAFDVIEHVEHPVPALQAIRAALAPGGQFVCTVPAFPFLWSPHDELNHHFRRYTRAALTAELTTAGFRLRHASYFNSLLFPPVAAVRAVRKLVPEKEAPHSDMEETIAPVNAVLRALFAFERHWVPRLRVPFGVSLIAVSEPV